MQQFKNGEMKNDRTGHEEDAMNRTFIGQHITQRGFKQRRKEILARLAETGVTAEERSRLEADLAALREKAAASGHAPRPKEPPQAPARTQAQVRVR